MRQRSQRTPNPRPAKIAAAHAALRRMQHRSGTTQPTAKMTAAREALQRLLSTVQPRCTAKVDRFEIGCTGLDMAEISRLEGYRRTRSHWLKAKSPTDFVPYRRVTAFRNAKSDSQILVYSDRKSPKMRPYRVVLIPDDKLGLQPGDALAVVDCAEQHRISKSSWPSIFRLAPASTVRLCAGTRSSGRAASTRLASGLVGTRGARG